MGINDPVYAAFHPKAWQVSSFDEIKKLLRDCNERVARQHFLISLLQPMEYTLYQPWLKGLADNAMRFQEQPVRTTCFIIRPILDRPKIKEIFRSLGKSKLTVATNGMKEADFNQPLSA
jgi:vacuolar-type H+-ATPase subunit C/Vma6